VRILHLGKFYPPHPGGVERHLAELARSQVRAGLNVAALVHALPGQSSSRDSDEGVQVERVACHGQLVFAPVSPGWPLRLRRLLREFRPDVLHMHVPNPSVFWTLASGAARDTPTVVHWHADIPHDSRHPGLRLGYPIYRQFEARLNARARRIVATSESYLDASQALQPWRDKCRVIPLGLVDAIAPGEPPVWPGNGLRLLAVGRLSYYKGFEFLIEAVARCPQVSLLIVGEGEQRGLLDSRIQALNLSARVRLAGRLDDAALEAAYRACDVFCLPSVDRAEAFGLVLLEAMRAGKPVLASDIPGSGVGVVVAADETGLLVAPRDVGALVAALERFIASPSLCDRMGRAGRSRWHEIYRLEAITPRWTQLYADLVDRPSTD
jgi:glycosyltransferase involved in cell wall biosynthesis